MIYLDNAATTKPSKPAITALMRSFKVCGNPSSLHQMGIDAEKELAHARKAIAGIIGAKPAEAIFTSSGTEANNLALFGTAKKHKGKQIITTKHEHSSILKPLEKLAEKDNFNIYYLNTINGKIDLDDLQNALAEPTCIVTTHHINNETGIIQDIQAIGHTIKKHSPATLFHIDAAQSFCKMPIDVADSKIDLLTLSAHKIGGLKGSGALFVKSGVNIQPIILGGGQENNLRSGTENLGGIMAFAAASTYCWQNYKTNFEYIKSLNDRFRGLLGVVDDITFSGADTSPYILDMDIAGVRSEVLLNALSAKDVFVSSGAACSSNKKGANAHRAETALRVSFGVDNTLEEIDAAIHIFAECIKALRKSARIVR
ncbi:MAG: cysteine desulfurase [Defluviitaleaceae bacterium]|nr:cysteine desulfurase [Defluviitaleaceae bacterium]